MPCLLAISFSTWWAGGSRKYIRTNDRSTELRRGKGGEREGRECSYTKKNKKEERKGIRRGQEARGEGTGGRGEERRGER